MEMHHISINSFLKLMLQELEKIILLNLSLPEITAQFSVISNLGSLIPRLVFAPIEEIAFNLFAKIKQKNDPNLLDLFCQILKFVSLTGYLTIVFGIPYLDAGVSILLGPSWTQNVIYKY